MVGPAPLGERAGDVSPHSRPHRADTRGRLSASSTASFRAPCVTASAGPSESLHAITGTPEGMFGNRAEQELGRLRSELDFTSIDDIITAGLHEFIDDVQSRLNRTGEAIFNCFFSGRAGRESRQLQEQFQ